MADCLPDSLALPGGPGQPGKARPPRPLQCLEEGLCGCPHVPEVARRVVALFREFRPPEMADHHLTPWLLKPWSEVAATRASAEVGRRFGVPELARDFFRYGNGPQEPRKDLDVTDED